MTTTHETRPPIKTFRAGRIEAAIWAQEKEEDGRTFLQHSVRVQNRYKDKDGEWKTTDYYYRDELPKLILAASKAYESIGLKESSGENSASSS